MIASCFIQKLPELGFYRTKHAIWLSLPILTRTKTSIKVASPVFNKSFGMHLIVYLWTKVEENGRVFLNAFATCYRDLSPHLTH